MAVGFIYLFSVAEEKKEKHNHKRSGVNKCHHANICRFGGQQSGALKVCKIVVAVVELETVRKLHLASWGFGDMKVGHGNRGVDVAREIFIKTSLKLQRTGAMFLGSAKIAVLGAGGDQWVE